MPISNYPAPRLPINNSQWRYTAVGGETILSGYDNFGQPLQYTVNNEMLYQNGVLLVRNVDYTASSGTSITGLTALSAGDTIEILTYSNFSLTTIPVANINGLIQNSQLQSPSITIGSTNITLGTVLTTLTGLTIDGTNNTIHTNRGATNPVTATAGDLFWNTTSNALQLWNGTSWISFAAPGAPTIGTATDFGTSRAYNNAAASITFTPNNSGGSATQFFVTSTPGSLTSYGTGSPITITGLTSGTSYTFAASAVGSFGNSPASNPTGALTATSVPQAPTIGTATPGNGNASVAFTANGTGGKTITSYTVASSSGAYNTGASSPIVVTESTNGTYQYTVTATNANGTSASSSSTSANVLIYPIVTGGALTSDSTYYYRTFNANGSLVVSNTTLPADILIIAGGGGGSGDAQASGGGGAGGVLYGNANSLSINTYSITIGAGGTSNEVPYGSAAQGNNSTLGSVSASGGGQGGWGTNGSSFSLYAGGNGGSGGGGGSSNANGTSSGGTVNQSPFSGYTSYGNGGGSGNGSGGTGRASGGGGGAGGGGTAGNSSGNAGNGGNGTNVFSSWLSAITSAMSIVSGWSTATSGGYIAGGGGGGGKNGGGSAGAGGGGAGGGGTNSSGTAGTPNTGGGAGSGFNDAADLTQNNGTKNGGSGLVVVRYTKASVGG